MEDIKKWLSSYRNIKEELEYINNRIEGVQGIKYSTAEGIGSGHNSLNYWIDKKTVIVNKMEEIEIYIDDIQDVQLKTICRYRFIDIKSIKEISIIMAYSISWVNNKIKVIDKIK